MLHIFDNFQAALFNRSELGPSEQISYMNWVAEGVLNRNQPWQNWKPKYFALKGSDVCIFDAPPVSKLFQIDDLYQSIYPFYKLFSLHRTQKNF